MEYLTASQAAKIIGVNKKTLLRWDEAGLLPVSEEDREGVLRSRRYEREKVEKIAGWRRLRKREKIHLRKLGAINKWKNKYIPLKPIDLLNPPKGLTPDEFKDMKAAYKASREWNEELGRIDREYIKFTEDYYRKIPDE
ncbi:MAG: MerR family transcriptional regulator [Patescibacteria group bacterium]